MALIPTKTGDGSTTLFDTEKKIYFRSVQGATTESAYVFCEASHIEDSSPPRKVLELGLGTGLNFLITADRLLDTRPGEALHYYVVEADPLGPELFLELEHKRWLRHPELDQLVHQGLLELSQSNCHYSQQTWGNIFLHIYKGRWQNTELPQDLNVQAIYHDPFGPADNPDCWTEACFRWSGQYLCSTGRLVTYAAATEMRRNLVSAGFVIASLPGSGRKREMTVAAFQEECLSDAKILRKARFYA